MSEDMERKYIKLEFTFMCRMFYSTAVFLFALVLGSCRMARLTWRSLRDNNIHLGDEVHLSYNFTIYAGYTGSRARWHLPLCAKKHDVTYKKNAEEIVRHIKPKQKP